jgi:hypothetical protein
LRERQREMLNVLEERGRIEVGGKIVESEREREGER